MTEIRFYHMERSSLETTLPGLLQKAVKQGHKIIIKSDTVHNTEALNTHLWTYTPESFLPHGSANDTKPDHIADQPIWLTDKDENPNNADLLILTHGATSEKLTDYKLCCEMLNGNNPEEIQAARTRWKTYKDQDDLTITYWQQDQTGKWEQKA